jgi:hypothetical protein
VSISCCPEIFPYLLVIGRVFLFFEEHHQQGLLKNVFLCLLTNVDL